MNLQSAFQTFSRTAEQSSESHLQFTKTIKDSGPKCSALSLEALGRSEDHLYSTMKNYIARTPSEKPDHYLE